MKSSGIGAGMVGHATVVHLLEKWLEHPAHGYLFLGPAHVGKRTLAIRFVQALLDDPRPDLNLAHPDLIVLEPEEGKQVISVELVRDARSRVMERPMVAPRVVMLVASAERLNEEGMNALLKVLEEPPAGAVFVFVADDASRLPATVRSRMVTVPFSTVPESEIAAVVGEQRAKQSRGRPGLAIEPLEQTSAVDDAKRFLGARTVGERLSIIDRLAKQCESTDDPRAAWSSALEEWGEAFRQELPHRPEMTLVAAQGMMTARRFVGGPLSPRLPLEAAALRLQTGSLENLFPSHIPQPFPHIFS